MGTFAQSQIDKHMMGGAFFVVSESANLFALAYEFVFRVVGFEGSKISVLFILMKGGSLIWGQLYQKNSFSQCLSW